MCLLFAQRLILAVALFALIGGHRGAVQCVAWAKMIYERSGERTFAEAVQSTFSGEEPCEICDALREGKKDNDQPAVLPTVKIDLAPFAEWVWIAPDTPVLATRPPFDPSAESSTSEPPTPPPPQLA